MQREQQKQMWWKQRPPAAEAVVRCCSGLDGMHVMYTLTCVASCCVVLCCVFLFLTQPVNTKGMYSHGLQVFPFHGLQVSALHKSWKSETRESKSPSVVAFIHVHDELFHQQLHLLLWIHEFMILM